MILEALFNIIFWVVKLIISLFPTFPSFSALNIDLSPFYVVLKFSNIFVDIKLIGVCFIMVLLVYNAKFVWSIFMWLIRKIPGIN